VPVVLAIDPGSRRTGIAISDPGGTLASPLLTHDRQKDGSLIELLARLCEEHQVERIVVGLPLTQMGAAGPSAEHARALADRLRRELPVAVQLVDERYSSAEADRILQGKRRPKGRRDAVAAALILQTFLDRQEDAS
jgi:putative Holliday junction resolvase